MKLKILLLSFLAVFLMAGTAMAFPYTVFDNYTGAKDWNLGDVIGNQNYFDISKSVVDISGTILSVDIYTNFAGRGDDGLFSGCTSQNKGIGYGDLFLSSYWDPYGSAPYKDDNYDNSTTWTYGFALDNRWWDGTGTAGGIGTLYSLVPGDILRSEHLMTGATYRNGQEVAVNIEGLTPGNIGSWSIDSTNNIVSFLVDISNTDLLTGDEIAFHWGMTCANDVIEGSAPVPEPSTMLLFGTGFLGLAMIGRKKLFKK